MLRFVKFHGGNWDLKLVKSLGFIIAVTNTPEIITHTHTEAHSALQANFLCLSLF